MKKILSATGIFAATSGAALAHPGDHQFPVVKSIMHLLSEPDHLAMMGLAAVAVAAIVYAFKRRSV